MSELIKPIGPRPIPEAVSAVPPLHRSQRRERRDDDEPRDRPQREPDEQPGGPDADGHVDVLA